MGPWTANYGNKHKGEADQIDYYTRNVAVVISAAFGFPEYPYGCVDRECDRDSVCLKRAKAALKKSNNSFEVYR